MLFFVSVSRIEKVGSDKCYKDLKSFWFQCTKGERYIDTRAPHLPSLEEIRKVRNDTLKADGIVVYEREVLSVRAVASNVKIEDEYFTRDCTTLLTLKWRVADTCEELLEILKKITMNRV